MSEGCCATQRESTTAVLFTFSGNKEEVCGEGNSGRSPGVGTNLKRSHMKRTSSVVCVHEGACVLEVCKQTNAEQHGLSYRWLCCSTVKCTNCLHVQSRTQNGLN